MNIINKFVQSHTLRREASKIISNKTEELAERLFGTKSQSTQKLENVVTELVRSSETKRLISEYSAIYHTVETNPQSGQSAERLNNYFTQIANDRFDNPTKAWGEARAKIDEMKAYVKANKEKYVLIRAQRENLNTTINEVLAFPKKEMQNAMINLMSRGCYPPVDYPHEFSLITQKNYPREALPQLLDRPLSSMLQKMLSEASRCDANSTQVYQEYFNNLLAEYRGNT